FSAIFFFQAEDGIRVFHVTGVQTCALPILLLYFAFHSVREALLIFTAIPLSAVGGILLLWIRDMPFSISAGVGFIALFGIAVLRSEERRAGKERSCRVRGAA